MFTAPQLEPRDPRFIPQPQELCMLATKWKGDVPAGGLVAQEKIDGIRALFFAGRLWSREGTPIEGVDHILAELRALERQAGEELFVDGEFQVDGTLAATLKHFRQAGRYGDAGWLYLFDAVPAAEWRTDRCQTPLTARLSRLEALVASCVPAHVRTLPTRLCGSPAALRTHAAAIWERGGEGSVAKVAGSLYRRRRSTDWLKLKPGQGAPSVRATTDFVALTII